jgi:transcriptional regulator with XRE-family HTH domain
MTVKERLKEYLKYKGIGQRPFSLSMGLSANYVNAIRKSIPLDTLAMIETKYPDLSKDWLLTGRGEMLREDKSQDKDKYIVLLEEISALKDKIVTLLEENSSLKERIAALEKEFNTDNEHTRKMERAMKMVDEVLRRRPLEQERPTHAPPYEENLIHVEKRETTVS